MWFERKPFPILFWGSDMRPMVDPKRIELWDDDCCLPPLGHCLPPCIIDNSLPNHLHRNAQGMMRLYTDVVREAAKDDIHTIKIKDQGEQNLFVGSAVEIYNRDEYGAASLFVTYFAI